MDFWGLPISDWQSIGLATAIMLGSVAVAFLVLVFLDKGLHALSRRTRTGLDDSILKAVRMPIFWAVVLIGMRFALNQLDFLEEQWAEARDQVFFVIFLLLGYWLILRLVDHLMRWYLAEMAERTETELDEKVLPFVRRLTFILLTVILAIVMLSHFNVDVSAMVTTLGIGSLAIALAAQNTLADTFGGLVIIADRPFTLGDRIEIQALDTWGDVVDIGLRSTRIRTRDNRLVVVPNSAISKRLVVNHSVPSTIYRVQTHVGVAYGTDIDRARQVMIDAIVAEDWAMHDRPIEALFIEYGDWALVFRVRCWIETYEETRRSVDKLNSCLYKALNEADIQIPAPTRTLYHHFEPSQREDIVAVLTKEPTDRDTA